MYYYTYLLLYTFHLGKGGTREEAQAVSELLYDKYEGIEFK